MKAWRCLLLLLVCSGSAAAPQLSVPHGRLGQSDGTGPAALWQSGPGPDFVIEASGELATGAGTLRRRALSGAASWEAGAILDRAAARNIVTPGPSGTTIAFAWSSLPPASRALLDQSDGLGELRTAFLRGDRSGEGKQFRTRAGRLGDIVGSTPLIVDGQMVYVGANDGMLHGFSATTGEEMFAYVPAALLADLPALASSGYQARPFVDGSAGYGRNGTRAVLASGMGMGARGVIALDLSAAAVQALWEFTAADDPAMGHVREAPQFIKTGPAQRWFALVTSGINNLAPDGAGALFLLALDKPLQQQWQRGVNYASIVAPGSYTLSAAALVRDAAGGTTLAYAGDLLGNLWRFDLRAMTAQRLFTARDSSGLRQPIAHAPKVVHAPGGGYLILFATGRLIEKSDLLPASYSDQSLYAIFDAGAARADPVASRAQLAARTMSASAEGYSVAGASVTYAGPDARQGWYADLPNARKAGERAAASPVSIASAMLFATVLPGGGGQLYLLDPLTGLAYDGAVTGGRSPVDTTLPLQQVDAPLEKSVREPTGRITVTRRVTLRSSTAPEGAAPPAIVVRYPEGRMGWREVANWPELHRAATGR
jgi:type IV pilus assembly protein PilY1